MGQRTWRQNICRLLRRGSDIWRILVVATSWNGTLEAIRMCDPKDFANKVVIDVTNPLDFSAGVPPRLAVGYTDSAGEIIQRLLPEAQVVKAFNIGQPTYGASNIPTLWTSYHVYLWK